MLKITILVGNPKPQSRTLKLAETLVDELLVSGTYDLRVIDLAEHSSQIFQWPSPEMSELNQAVRRQ
jgi:FMN reductase